MTSYSIQQPASEAQRCSNERPARALLLPLALPALLLMGCLLHFVPRLRAAGDGDLGGLVNFGAVLRDEFGGHRELVLAEVAVGGERGVRTLRERQFEALH